MSEWSYVEPLTNRNLIAETEDKLGIKFDRTFIECVKKHNGGCPPIDVFDTEKTNGRTIESFLSFNPSAPGNIIISNKYVLEMSDQVIAFAIDSFGNYICFEKTSGRIVFLDFETGMTELIANNFDTFLNILEGGTRSD